MNTELEELKQLAHDIERGAVKVDTWFKESKECSSHKEAHEFVDETTPKLMDALKMQIDSIVLTPGDTFEITFLGQSYEYKKD